MATVQSLKDIVHHLRSIFWSEYFWLPPEQFGITWKTFEQKSNGIKYVQFNDIYYALYTAMFIFIIRFMLERYLFKPVGIKFGIIDYTLKPPKLNALFEQVYLSKQDLKSSTIERLARKTDMDVKDVLKWFEKRKLVDKPTTIVRFSESAWRCSFYTFTFIYGLWALYDKPWTYDSAYFFADYPHHSITPEIWWYYNIELGYYISSIITQFYDVHLSDFWALFTHHVATVLLLCFSWACNFHRIGSLVMIIHDIADIPLEAAKMVRNLRFSKLSSLASIIFVICWIVTRLYLLPTRVIYYVAFYVPSIYPERSAFPAYYIFNSLLCLLQVLHLFWTYLIACAVYNAVFARSFRDLRETDDEYDLE